MSSRSPEKRVAFNPDDETFDPPTMESGSEEQSDVPVSSTGIIDLPNQPWTARSSALPSTTIPGAASPSATRSRRLQPLRPGSAEAGPINDRERADDVRAQQPRAARRRGSQSSSKSKSSQSLPSPNSKEGGPSSTSSPPEVQSVPTKMIPRSDPVPTPEVKLRAAILPKNMTADATAPDQTGARLTSSSKTSNGFARRTKKSTPRDFASTAVPKPDKLNAANPLRNLPDRRQNPPAETINGQPKRLDLPPRPFNAQASIQAAAPSSFTTFRGERQPCPEIRLKQIKVFLADEDYFRYPPAKFLQNLADIEAYLDDLESNIWDYDVDVVKHIRAMIEVHRQWIRKETEVPDLDYSFADVANREPWLLQLALLSKDSKSLMEKIKYLVSGWKQTGVGMTNTGIYARTEELPRGEPLCLRAEKSKWENEPDTFEYTKKLKQYRLTTDLNYAQVRNDLLYKNRDNPCYVPPPVSLTSPYVPILKAQIQEGKQLRYDELTQLFEDLLAAQIVAPRPLLQKLLIEISTTISDERADSQFVVSTPLQAAEDPEMEALFDPQPLTREDIDNLSVLAQRSWLSDSAPLAHDNPDQTALLQEFYIPLEALFSNVPVGNRLTVDEIMEGVNTALAETYNELDDERSENQSDPQYKDKQYSRDMVKDFLRLICKAKRYRSTLESDGIHISRRTPDVHPEQRFVDLFPSNDFSSVPDIRVANDGTTARPTFITGYDFLFLAARRLGREIREIREWGSSPDRTNTLDGKGLLLGEQWDALEKAKEMLDDPEEGYTQPTMADIAAPLNTGTEELTEEEAAKLVLLKTVVEQHENLQSREPDARKLWGWAEGLVSQRTIDGKVRKQYKFFSLDRWPLELQTPERQAQIMAAGPDSLSSPGEDDLDNQEGIQIQPDQNLLLSERESRETYYPGECIFPFGETGFQRAYKSYQIERGLEDVPEFADNYTREARRTDLAASKIDMYALPEILESKRSRVTTIAPDERPSVRVTEEDIIQSEIDLVNLRQATERSLRKIAEDDRKRKAAAQATRMNSKRPKLVTVESQKT